VWAYSSLTNCFNCLSLEYDIEVDNFPAQYHLKQIVYKKFEACVFSLVGAFVFVIFGSLLSVEIVGLLSFLCVCVLSVCSSSFFCQSYSVYTLYYLRIHFTALPNYNNVIFAVTAEILLKCRGKQI